MSIEDTKTNGIMDEVDMTDKNVQQFIKSNMVHLNSFVTSTMCVWLNMMTNLMESIIESMTPEQKNRFIEIALDKMEKTDGPTF